MNTRSKLGWFLIVMGALLFVLGFVIPVVGWVVGIPGGVALAVVGGIMIAGGRIRAVDEGSERRSV